jgi:NADH-quinone oxidoreductase subunit J
MPIGLVVAGCAGGRDGDGGDQRGDHGLAAAANTTPMASAPDVSNVVTIGSVLYTDYVYVFQGAGLVLLVAMIGAIVLTLRHKPGVKRQNIGAQVARTPKTGMRIVQIKSGAGVEEEAPR